MSPWEEMLRLLAEEPEEEKSLPALAGREKKSPEEKADSFAPQRKKEESGEGKSGTKKEEDGEKTAASLADSKEQGRAQDADIKAAGEIHAAAGQEKTERSISLPSRLQREQSRENEGTGQTVRVVRQAGAAELPTAGLTETEVLALLDRYLTEEFLGTGGEFIGYD